MLEEVGIWILFGIVALAGMLIGILLTLWLRRLPEAKQLQRQLEELQRRIDEGQKSAATQEQVEGVRKSLAETHEGIVRVSEGLQSLYNFAQQTLHPQVISQLQDAQYRLTQSLEAMRSVQDKLSEQSSVDEHRHGQIVERLQRVQETLEVVRTLIDQISNQWNNGHQELVGKLSGLQQDLGIARETIQSIANQVNILTTMGKAVDRIEANIGELTSMLLGRRSGQAGERMVEKLLSPVPDDWLERDISLGKGKVEFALKMPGGYLVPLDSKFVGPEITSRLTLDDGGDDKQQQQAIQQINELVRRRAQEIAERYLVDERALGFGIAAVPDAAYEACKGAIQTSAQRHQIVIVPYSLLLPYTLSLYLIAQRLGITQMTEKEKAIATAQTALQQAKTHLENMDREITSVSNLRRRALERLEEALFYLASSSREEPFPS
jgi:DNA anti-recombination protein RmuC